MNESNTRPLRRDDRPPRNPRNPRNPRSAWSATTLIRGVAASTALGLVAVHLGWSADEAPIGHGVAHVLQVCALVLIGVVLAIESRIAGGLDGRRLEAGALIAIAPLLWWWPAAAVGACFIATLHAIGLLAWLSNRSTPPALIFLGVFVALIMLGTGALLLPNATAMDAPIGFVDALFTSTSAVCVTGLIVRDTATEFTRFGQCVILALIQLGALGIVLFGALMALTLGSSFGLRASRTLADTSLTGMPNPATVRRLAAFVVLLTLATELVGAVFFYFGWPEAWRSAPEIAEPADRAFHSIFFAVSGFCNAGFATTSDSLMGLRFHWTSHTVMAGLITIGGLGFPVLDNLRSVLWNRLRGRRFDRAGLSRLSLHSKMALTVTAVCYVGLLGIGFAGLAIQRDEPLTIALLDAHFLSITSRTAGFNTIDTADMGPLATFGVIVFMFIGGSPGSTAGGVKTIVVGVLALTIVSTITGRSSPQGFRRRLPEEVIHKAATLITLGVGVIAALTITLAATEGGADGAPPLGDLLFEAVSACSTVGLSTGITPTLSDPGRLAVVAGMFLGRVGPLAMLVAMVSVTNRRRIKYEYPTEGLVMG